MSPKGPKARDFGSGRILGGSKNRCFWAMLKFISQEVPLERAIWCSSELTKGRKQPAYVCKWKRHSKHGVSALQRASVNAPSQQRANGREQLKPSQAVAGEALPQSSTGQLRVAMGSLTAPPGLLSVGSRATCCPWRPQVGTVDCLPATDSSVCR